MAIISKSALEWSALPNYILAAGDTGFEKDTCSRKIGDGITKWADLEYEDLILHRRDLKRNWLAKDPILGNGEMVLETDTKRHKIGDGKKRYSQLDYGDNTVMQLLNMIMPPEYNLTSIGSGGIQQGGLSDQGEEIECDYIIRTPIMDLTTVDGLLSSVNEGWLQQVYIYDHQNNFLDHNGWQVAPIDIVCENRKVRLAFKKFDHPDISIEDYQNCGNNLRSKKLVPGRSQAATKKSLEEFILTLNSIIGNNEDLITVEKVLVDAINGLKTDSDKLQTAIEVKEIANLSEIDDFAPTEGHRFYALNLAGTETAYLMHTVYNGIATQMLWTSRIIEGNKQSDEGMCLYTRIKKDGAWGEWQEAGASGSGAGNVFNVDKFIPFVAPEGSEATAYNLKSAVKAVLAYKGGKFICPGLIITFKGADNTFKSYQFHSDTIEDFDEISVWVEYGGSDRVKRIFVNNEECPNIGGNVNINLDIPQVDAFLDEESTNTVQNKVVAEKFKALGQNMLKDVEIIPDEDNGIVTLEFWNMNGELITSVDVPAMGGGGSGDGSAVTRIALSASLADDEMKKGDSNILSYSYAHTYVGGEENGEPTGTRANITVQVKSGIEVLHEFTENNVAQGSYTYELPTDLPAGVIDVYVIAVAKDPINPDKTQKRTAYTTTRVYDLSLKSSFDLRTNFITALNANGIVTVPFAITGAGNKTIKLHLDGNGNAYASQTITDSGTTNSSFQVNLGDSKLQSGRHNIQIIAEITTSTGKVIKSNLLYIDLYKPYASSVTTKKPFVGIKHSFNRDMFVSYEYQNPVFDFKQYEETSIEYVVYKEDSPTVPLTIKENGSVIQSSVAAREVYTYLNRYTSTGTFNNVITAGSGNVITEYEYQVVIGKSDVNIEEVTDSMSLKLIAAGRSNNESESVRNKWAYGDITTEFFGFDWKLNGWMNNQLVMNNGASININYKPFTTEALATGKTLEFEIITSNIFDKDALILSCMQQSGNNLIGFDMTTREARLITKGGSVIATKFAPDMKLRICFVIESKEQNRMLMLYVNGICCGAIQYASSDSLMQDSPSLPITINSVPCDVALSCIRVYNRALNSDELLRNYIADRTSSTEMSTVFKRNDILDENGEKIDMTKLVSQGKSVMMITGDLTWLDANNNKKTKIKCDFTLWDHKGDILSGTSAGVSLQGTSSLLYPRKNYRLYFNEYTDTAISFNGESVPTKGYSIRPQSRPVGLFCLKADFAESSGTHNTGIARILNDSWKDCGFLTPPQKANKDEYDVRIGVDGFPVVLFHRKDENSTPVFIGHYNFNNDKAESEVVYGFKDIPGYNDEETLAGDENPCICLEMLNNTGDICNFRTTDLSKFDDDLEFRFPDQKSNEASEAQMAKIQELWNWVFSCKDKPAKFKDEYQNYFDKNSLLGWYIYTEYFMALDQRVKNTMLATWGDKWYYIPYDNDTVLGVHNKGELVYDYDIDETSLDPLGGEDNLIYAFMGHDSVLWNLIRSKEMYDDLASVAKKIRDKMTTPYVLQVLNDIQMGEWSERVYNKDADWKYIVPATSGVENLSGEFVKYNYISSLQGSRYAHRTYIVRNRFALMDSKYVAGEFAGDEVGYRLHNDFATNPGRIWLKPTEKFFFAHGINSNVVEGALLPGEDGRVTMKLTSAYTQNDPAKIFGASKILELDLSNVAKYLISGINFNKCKNMTILKMSSVNDTESVNNTGLNTINMSGCINLREMYMDGMMNTSLKTLDLSDCRKLTTLVAGTTNLTSIQFADGVNPTKVVLPPSLQALEFKSSKVTLGNLSFYEGDEGWGNLERVVLEACPNVDWVDIVNKCRGLKFLRSTGIYTYGNGDILTEIMNRGIGGVDSYGSNIAGKCFITGIYQLTREVSETQLAIWKTYFSDLDIKQPQFTTLEFDLTVAAPDNVSNLDNKTGSRYGNDYQHSAAITAILNQRKRVLGKYSFTKSSMVICPLDNSDSTRYTNGESAILTGEEGDVFVYEPHYWYKGVNDILKSKQYHLYAFTDEAPVSKASYKRVNINDGALIEHILSYRVHPTGIMPGMNFVTDRDKMLNYNSTGTVHVSLDDTIKEDYNLLRVVSRSPGDECRMVFLDENQTVISVIKPPMDLNIAPGQYLAPPIPENAKSFLITVGAGSIDNYEMLFIKCDENNMIEAIEPDWVEHKACLVGVYKAFIKNGILRSISDVTTADLRKTKDYYSSYIPNYTGYQLMDYSMHKDLFNIAVAKYGRKDLHAVCGVDYNLGVLHGYSNSSGMTDSQCDSSDYKAYLYNSENEKVYNAPSFMGYEASYTGMQEFLYNVTITVNQYAWMPTTFTIKDGYTGQNRTVQASNAYKGGWVEIITAYNEKYMDITPGMLRSSAGSSQHYMMTTLYNEGPNVVNKAGALVFATNTPSATSGVKTAFVGNARLAFTGKIDWASSVEEFKKLNS